MSDETLPPLDGADSGGSVTPPPSARKHRAEQIVRHLYAAALRLWSAEDGEPKVPGFLVASDGVDALLMLAPSEFGDPTITVYQVDLESGNLGVDADGLIDVFVPTCIPFPADLSQRLPENRDARLDWVQRGAATVFASWREASEEGKHPMCCATGGVW